MELVLGEEVLEPPVAEALHGPVGDEGAHVGHVVHVARQGGVREAEGRATANAHLVLVHLHKQQLADIYNKILKK